ncbi:MAG: ribosome-associated translation inhibitor RaiA [Candidatus Saelkia tenebricola]|nr:ribosome-associated translation inhibitor RaiA [Candidatus Saelkia tenebricola]
MKLVVTGRHFTVTQAIKSYLEEKMSRLDKYAKDIIDAKVILQMEKHDAVVEVNMRLKKNNINVKECNLDMYAAIDKSFDVLKNKIIRYADKRKDHRHRKVEEPVED